MYSIQGNRCETLSTQRNALLVHYNKTYYPSYLIAEWEHARNLAQLLTVLRKIMTVSAN